MEPIRTCTSDVCDKPVRCKGLCSTHYREDNKHLTECKFSGCTRARNIQGYCVQHAEVVPGLARCTYYGCERAARIRGLCSPHYEQWRRGDELRPLVDWRQIPCRGPLCTRMSDHHTGYCTPHHRQRRDYGDVWVLGTRQGRAQSNFSCLEAGCASVELVAHGYCLEHASNAKTDCWLPWCSALSGGTTGLCESHRGKGNWMRHQYGIGWEERLRLSRKQNGKCAICRSVEEDLAQGLALHVDHCHKTGRVRGLLCGPCNRGIGLLAEDPKSLRAAVRYLEAAGV